MAFTHSPWMESPQPSGLLLLPPPHSLPIQVRSLIPRTHFCCANLHINPMHHTALRGLSISTSATVATRQRNGARPERVHRRNKPSPDAGALLAIYLPWMGMDAHQRRNAGTAKRTDGRKKRKMHLTSSRCIVCTTWLLPLPIGCHGTNSRPAGCDAFRVPASRQCGLWIVDVHSR